MQLSVSSKSEYLPESLMESTIVLSIDVTLTPLIQFTKASDETLIKVYLFPTNVKLLNLLRDETFTLL